MRTFFVISIVVLIVAASPETWEDRISASRRSRLCTNDGPGSWVERIAPLRCATCHSRCYKAEFDAQVETSGAPADLCDTSGDVCRISVFLATQPCCRCAAGHEEQSQLFAPDNETRVTESRCEVTSMVTLVNGQTTLPLFSPVCNATEPPLFVQSWLFDAYTANSVRDCAASATAGSWIRQVYNTNYRNGRYPDPCFADSHWRATHNALTSRFTMWRPGSGLLWFDHALTIKEAPREINCAKVPAVL